MSWKMILGLVLLGFVAIFTIQNAEVVSIKFLIWEFSLSRVLMVPFLLGTGVIIGWLLGTLSRRRSP